jgi:hypothetical protein
MKDPLRTFAQDIVLTSKLLVAGWYLFWALMFALIGLWLATPFDSLIWTILGLFLTLGCGGPLLTKASEFYVNARPEPLPDERQRYLQSKLFYRPDNANDHRRQPSSPHHRHHER